MKSPTFATAYVGPFPVLAELAHGQGYALAVHGSVTRDLDLIAVPWTPTAGPAEHLMGVIADRVQAVMSVCDGPGILLTARPFGLVDPAGRRRSSTDFLSRIAMPTGTSVVHQACLAKAAELQCLFDSGAVKVNAVNLGLTMETWETVQAYCESGTLYVSDPDGDYLLRNPSAAPSSAVEVAKALRGATL